MRVRWGRVVWLGSVRGRTAGSLERRRVGYGGSRRSNLVISERIREERVIHSRRGIG